MLLHVKYAIFLWSTEIWRELGKKRTDHYLRLIKCYVIWMESSTSLIQVNIYYLAISISKCKRWWPWSHAYMSGEKNYWNLLSSRSKVSNQTYLDIALFETLGHLETIYQSSFSNTLQNTKHTSLEYPVRSPVGILINTTTTSAYRDKNYFLPVHLMAKLTSATVWRLSMDTDGVEAMMHDHIWTEDMYYPDRFDTGSQSVFLRVPSLVPSFK